MTPLSWVAPLNESVQCRRVGVIGRFLVFVVIIRLSPNDI